MYRRRIAEEAIENVSVSLFCETATVQDEGQNWGQLLISQSSASTGEEKKKNPIES